MLKSVLKYGLISGLIMGGISLIFWAQMEKNHDLTMGMVIGYATMLLSFITIFLGLRNYRNKMKNESFTFGKALAMGLLISLVASMIYSLAWTVFVQVTDFDFMEVYADSIITSERENGASDADISKTMAQMEEYKEIYKNPFLIFLVTIIEPLPVGVIVSLFSGLILRQKQIAQ